MERCSMEVKQDVVTEQLENLDDKIAFLQAQYTLQVQAAESTKNKLYEATQQRMKLLEGEANNAN